MKLAYIGKNEIIREYLLGRILISHQVTTSYLWKQFYLGEKDYDLIIYQLPRNIVEEEEFWQYLNSKRQSKLMLLVHHNDAFIMDYKNKYLVEGIADVLSTGEEIKRMVELVLAGEKNYSLNAHDLYQKRKLKSIPYNEREWLLLVLLKNDLSNKEIAERMGCNIRTVQRIKSGLLEKHGLKNEANLLIQAFPS